MHPCVRCLRAGAACSSIGAEMYYGCTTGKVCLHILSWFVCARICANAFAPVGSVFRPAFTTLHSAPFVASISCLHCMYEREDAEESRDHLRPTIIRIDFWRYRYKTWFISFHATRWSLDAIKPLGHRARRSLRRGQ